MLNRFRNWLRTWLLGSAAAIIAPIEEEARKGIVVSTGVVAQISRNRGLLTPMSAAPVFATRRQVFEAARPVFAADGETPMARDWNGSQTLSWAVETSYGGEGIGFLGYPYLAELSQRPEYRRISEIPAEEMTRKWIRFTSKSGGDKKGVIEKLTEACESFKLRERFRQMAELDGLFGRAQLFVDIKGTRDDREELKLPLVVDKRKIERGSLLGFNIVEPMWSYPLQYNSDNPLRPDFFVPQSWSVQGFEVHRTRLLTFVGRPMPDLLKPAYAFGGLSLSQMALPYVNNWIRTRQSVSDLIHSFSIMVLATNMSNTLDTGAMADLIKRVEAAVAFRDNRGLQVIDKEAETLTNVAAPLSGLDSLQAQSQEQMASVAQIPLVKLLGITPSGLNASSDGEIRVFYDHVKAGQEKFFGDNLKVALDLIQLHEFGAIDVDIGYEFVPLWELDEAGQSAIEKTEADTAAVYIEAGVIDPEEERDRLKATPKSRYTTLKGPAPEPPDMGEGEIEGESPSGNPAKSLGEPKKTTMAGDEFREGDHPRDGGGKFTSGGGGGGGKGGGTESATKGEHYVAPAKFNAAHFAAQHDDQHVTSESVLAHFPSDTKAKMDGLISRLRNEPQTIDMHRDEAGNWTPERQALHDSIRNHFLGEARIRAARPESGQRPTFTILGGRGGSGKSWFKGQVYNPETAIVLDSDEIKHMLPEYKGWNAAQVHEESGHLFDKITEVARQLGLNIVHDATMKTPEKAVDLVKGFKEAGYSIEAHYMHLPRQEAAKRAVERFLGPTERLVPPEVVLANTKNEQAFQDVREHADRWSFRDNNVPRGEPPRLISEND